MNVACLDLYFCHLFRIWTQNAEIFSGIIIAPNGEKIGFEENLNDSKEIATHKHHRRKFRRPPGQNVLDCDQIHTNGLEEGKSIAI